MRTIKLLVMFLIIFASKINLCSQTFIDTVYSVTWGEKGTDFGRSAEHFPQNIFGPPAQTASKYVPAASEDEVVSLGFSGEIVVGAKQFYVVNKEGPDFIIFENVFSTLNDLKIFVEPAIISVSQDGINFVEFPYNPNTLEGLAGINWTNGDADCFDYEASGGDVFDLEIIGLDSITHIKIKDTSLLASQLPTSHKYYSPASVLSGFDLDAVVLLNVEPVHSSISGHRTNDNLQISYQSNLIIISTSAESKIKVFDILGEELFSKQISNYLILDKQKFKNGIYFIAAESTGKIEFKKFLIY